MNFFNLLLKRFSIKTNDRAYFIDLCKVYSKIESTKSKKEKQKLFYDYLKFVDSSLNIETALKITIPSVYDENISKMKDINLYESYDSTIKIFLEKNLHIFPIESVNVKKSSDLSNLIIEYFKRSDKIFCPNLTLQDIFSAKQLFLQFNQNILSRRILILSDLFNRCFDKREALYIIRIFSNKLKIGLGEKSVMNLIEIIKKEGYFNLGNHILKNKYYSSLIIKNSYSIINTGSFINPMLCQFSSSLESIIDIILLSKEIILENKFDGERTQIHFDGKELKFLSRYSEDQSEIYTNLYTILINDLNLNKNLNFILDGEIVSISNSKRKYGSYKDLQNKDLEDIDLYIIVFDIMYLNNESIVNYSLEERKDILLNKFINFSNKLVIYSGKKISLTSKQLAIDIINRELINSLEMNCEGLILKNPNEVYEIGKRKWFKIKQLENGNYPNLDLVPIAGYFEPECQYLSSFIMGTYYCLNNVIYAIGKVEFKKNEPILIDINNDLKEKIIYLIPENYRIKLNYKPDVYFRPSAVWEVSFDNFFTSPQFSLNKEIFDELKPNLGIYLKNIKFVKIRKDKGMLNSTNFQEILLIYQNKNLL